MGKKKIVVKRENSIDVVGLGSNPTGEPSFLSEQIDLALEHIPQGLEEYAQNKALAIELKSGRPKQLANALQQIKRNQTKGQ